jgi:hypothetical protein
MKEESQCDLKLEPTQVDFENWLNVLLGYGACVACRLVGAESLFDERRGKFRVSKLSP